jgi:flavorubredoxin
MFEGEVHSLYRGAKHAMRHMAHITIGDAGQAVALLIIKHALRMGDVHNLHWSDILMMLKPRKDVC